MADETDDGAKNELPLHSAGDILRLAREQKNLSIEEVAKLTRVPQRHLMSIETGDYSALPGRTYAIGFAKSYARAVDLSDATIGAQIRDEMDEQGHGAYQPESSGYSPDESGNIPPKTVALSAAAIALIVLVAFIIWRSFILNPAEIEEVTADNPAVAEAAPVAAAGTAIPEQPVEPAATTGTVVLTATDKVWIKIYDESGERLFENEMSAGDTFTVPADAKNPQILTGRPNALTVTVDGQVVAPLGSPERTIKDVGVSAAALLARTDGQTDSAATPTN